MRVAQKLWITILSLLSILLLVSLLTQYRNDRAMSEAMASIERIEQSITLTTRWQGLTEVVIERTMAYINVVDPAASNMLGERTKANSAQISDIQQQVGQNLSTAAEKEAFDKISKVRAEALAVLKQIPEVKAKGDPAAALAFTQQQFLPATQKLFESLQQLVQVQNTLRDQISKDAEATRQWSSWITLLAGALVYAVAVVAVLWLVRSITQPLHDTVTQARAIGHGDLTQNVTVNRSDEFGDLQTEFMHMTERLRSLVAQVRQGVDAISTASTEIANGNNDLSSRTEQTASSLQETAASMEELTSTVNQSASTAQRASELAVTAAQAATRGGDVVDQVVSSMQHITESSRRISDIIGVIDGIAFQTNIMALNAAVEAARAGEQGRGFAVVAGEVRTLAQRSAAAAKEIKDLINQSVASVEQGSQQVEQAGEAMDRIVSGVREVSALITEISSSAGEQREGIGQINHSVGALDQMTQQNAALVEEAAAAATSLREQAHHLAQVVSVFKTGH
ncbi:MAG: methyl-accepting chemotaxis protein [Macromonas sp.]